MRRCPLLREKKKRVKPAMRYPSLNIFADAAPKALAAKGPFAVVLLEDEAEVDSTIQHCLSAGFSDVIVAGHPELLPGSDDGLHLVALDIHEQGAFCDMVNAVIQVKPTSWIHYCYNAEYLFFPFCETRNVRELTEFNNEERRDTIMTYVIDLYSNDLGQHANAVSREQAYFDRAGYYALQRVSQDGKPLERQLDFFGGLRWRFEEHVPWLKRRIDRVGMFKAHSGLKLQEDHTFNDAEYNTYSCPWHHNISATICSFRTAKALITNPGSKYAIPHFWWKGSEKFHWNSNQLMEHGLMEPGQWF
jgi:hypothetical protein